MEVGDFKHSIPIQIRFNDIDKVNHVNNAVYHTYIELGRVHYFNVVFDRTVDWNNEGFVLARTEIDYRKPIFLRDTITCFTKFSSFKNKSFTMQSLIAKKTESGLEVCATALCTLVCMNFITQKSIDIPEAWKEKLLAFENT